MNPNELINAKTLLTLGGSALGVTLFSNVLQYVFGWSPRWLALLVALGLAGAGAVLAHAAQWLDWVVALFQGLQIYATAVGISAATGTGPVGKKQSEVERGEAIQEERGETRQVAPRRFWPKWY
jgi:hypothetical protein